MCKEAILTLYKGRSETGRAPQIVVCAFFLKLPERLLLFPFNCWSSIDRETETLCYEYLKCLLGIEKPSFHRLRHLGFSRVPSVIGRRPSNGSGPLGWTEARGGEKIARGTQKAPALEARKKCDDNRKVASFRALMLLCHRVQKLKKRTFV